MTEKDLIDRWTADGNPIEALKAATAAYDNLSDLSMKAIEARKKVTEADEKLTEAGRRVDHFNLQIIQILINLLESSDVRENDYVKIALKTLRDNWESLANRQDWT
jgi:hypothetical protein